MKYAVIVTYTSGEKTGSVVLAGGHAAAWRRISELFDMNHVRAIELAEIMTEDRFESERCDDRGEERKK